MRCHMFVSGRVQGVFFRKSAQAKAQELGLVGFARNLPDGRVEIVCEGWENMDEFIRWCEKGPLLARVDHLEVIAEEHTGEFQDFEVR